MKALDDFHAHALTEYPKEACGLLVVVKGRKRYFPCRNMADTPGEHFVVAPEDYAAAEDKGEIIEILHSHPNLPATPSQADRVSCEGTGLAWRIVSVMPGDDGPVVAGEERIEPEGYEAPLVGREFVHGVLDCYSLCRDWYASERGILLPDFERRDQWWDDGSSDLYTEHFREVGFEEIDIKRIQPGDAILMQIKSHNLVPNHAAIYLGDGLILHHMYGRLSSRDIYGGYWQEVTRAVLRYVGPSTEQEVST